MRSRIAAAVLCAAFAGLSDGALAASWHEGTSGDLSNDRLLPSSLSLDSGLNSISGTTVAGDRDYITVVAPFEIGHIYLGDYTSTNGFSFIAVQAGSTLSEPAVGANPANLLGWTHFGYDTAATEFSDVLDNLGAASPAIGFIPPLAAGTYTFWIQQTGPELTAYQFDFIVAPEPAGLALLGVGLGALALLRRLA